MGVEFRNMLKENGGAVQFMMKTLDTTDWLVGASGRKSSPSVIDEALSTSIVRIESWNPMASDLKLGRVTRR